MARDGSGDYSRVVTPPTNGDVADADDFNAEINDIATALSESINKNGTKAFAANQPMGGYKLTGLAAGSSNGDSVRYEQLTGLSSTYQPLDALLTAIAALTTADDRMLDFTGTDTVAVVTYATVLSNIGATTLAAVQANGNTFTANQTISNTDPALVLIETDGGTNAKRWRLAAASEKLYVTLLDDSGVAVTDLIAVTRSGGAPTILEVDAADLRIEATPTALATNSAGFRGAPVNIQNNDYTFVLADNGRHVHHQTGTHSYTIPPNSSVAFPTGTVIVVSNFLTSLQILQGSGVTLYRFDGTAATGTRNVLASGVATLIKTSTNDWLITGAIS
mgnify:CR=1 FL=1